MHTVILLQNWSVYKDPYSAPETGFQLHGNVYGHPRFLDGDPIFTSRVVDYKKGIFITQSGSYYQLGNVDSKYEELFPDARRRLIKAMETPR